MFRPSDLFELPVAEWVNAFVRGWLVPQLRPVFRAAQAPVAEVLNAIEALFQAMPMLLLAAALAALAWRVAGTGLAIFTASALIAIDLMGLWPETMTTLSMVLTSVIFCTIIGVPLGILAARSNIAFAIIRPLLDVMQTIPSFVYLVPIVMLFGVGIVPGIIATIIFALPPIVRLTNLGIREVRADLIEAAEAFGATRWQLLVEVQLPLAIRTILAGLNQTLMLSLSMVVIAALIGAGGLGLTVYTGLGRLDVGTATAGGIGIVLLAIILDRITQAAGRQHKVRVTTFRGTLASLFRLRPQPAPEAGKAG